MAKHELTVSREHRPASRTEGVTSNEFAKQPTMRAVHERMIAAGKPPKVALIAIARKLLTILNARVRDGRDWQQVAV